jgi:hypothetical protein
MENEGRLPVSIDGGLIMDEAAAVGFGASLAEAYSASQPYPHTVIEDFLPRELIDRLSASFPEGQRDHDSSYKVPRFEVGKRAILPYDCDAFAQQAFHFFNGAPFIRFLEAMTGIEGLIPDPYFVGGGFHETAAGGKLGIHADFRIHKTLHLHRRVNVLIYLNRDWDDAFGGQLELWRQDMSERVQSISPIYNRCVVFNTEADAYHGHPDPLRSPDGVTRRSIALYYYTASKSIYAEAENLTTKFMARPGDAIDDQLAAAAYKLRQTNTLARWVPPAIYWWLKRRSR